MKGDFSRFTFDPRKHYSSVRMQQGRVQLDADWNEQADILLHLITTQLQDLLGPSGTTVTKPGFAITAPATTLPDFQIEAGRYYVDGILCENEEAVLFSEQPDYPAAASLLQELKDHEQLLVYLDVWQRHITAIEDPAIRETALGGPDTTTRGKTVWQVKLLPLSGRLPEDQGRPDRGDLRPLSDWEKFVEQSAGKGRLKARWDIEKGGFAENHLYRVEIHSVAGDEATFKWSRENGSVVFPLTHLKLEKDPTGGQRLIAQVEGLRDFGLLRSGDWVEIVDDTTVLNGTSRPLCQVLEPPEQVDLVARVALSVPEPPADDAILSFLSLDKAEMALEEAGPAPDEAELRQRHAILRRWDHRESLTTAQTTVDETTKAALADGALVEVPIKNRNTTWLALERGLEVCFSEKGTYQAGDYWLIPARARPKHGIEWPQEGGEPLAQAPQGIVHHYAPLALLQFEGEWQADDLRLKVDSLTRVIVKEREVKESLADLQQQIEGVGTRLDQEFVRMQELADRAGRLQTYESLTASEGDVVALDRNRLDRVVPANHDNATLVVGVAVEVYEREGGRFCLVAQYGRASCKVAGQIEPGDVLVPSAKLGHAQKAGRFQKPGTILGKALGSIRLDAEVMEEIEEGQRPDQIVKSKWTGTVDMMVMLG